MKKIKVTGEVSVPSAQLKLAGAAVFGAVVGIFVAVALGSWKTAPLVAWDVAALAYLLTTWPRLLRFDAALVKKHALREDPSRVASDIIVLCAAIVSLVAVALVLVRGGGLPPSVGALLAVSSVVISWSIIHTVYALRYAEIYYRNPQGGIDFGGQDPVYSDFAYLAFTLGMTFQVSDTPFQRRELRAAGLRHALLSYLFGTVIIATTINLVAGLGK